MKKNGTMVTVQQHCKNCQSNFTWRSQPFVLGNYPAGNILLSFSVLMAGASISKLRLVFKHFGMQVYEARTFFYHQSKFIFPAIQQYWESYQSALVTSLRSNENLVWSGDGRFDSMGHSAKYGVYTMMCSPSTKIVHFELLQVLLSVLCFENKKHQLAIPTFYQRPGNREVYIVSSVCFREQLFCWYSPKQSHDAMSTTIVIVSLVQQQFTRLLFLHSHPHTSMLVF